MQSETHLELCIPLPDALRLDRYDCQVVERYVVHAFDVGDGDRTPRKEVVVDRAQERFSSLRGLQNQFPIAKKSSERTSELTW